MRKTLLYVPIVLSLLVLAAHFLRAGNEMSLAISLLLIAGLFVRRRWMARVVQAALVLGALEWLRTLYVLAQLRAAQGEPFTRMAIILGVVAALSLVSALIFETHVMRRIYRR